MGKREKTIKVLGIGGGGGNIVDNISTKNDNLIEYAFCDYKQDRLNSRKKTKRFLLSAVGKTDAIAENYKTYFNISAHDVTEPQTYDTAEIAGYLKDAELVVMVACLGGRNHIVIKNITRQLKEARTNTLSIVTLPFSFEGTRRIIKANTTIAELRNSADAVVVLDNNVLMKHFKNKSITAAFLKIDELVQYIITLVPAKLKNKDECLNSEYWDRVVNNYVQHDFKEVEKKKTSFFARVFKAIKRWFGKD